VNERERERERERARERERERERGTETVRASTAIVTSKFGELGELLLWHKRSTGERR
jgi:hypothetical protein